MAHRKPLGTVAALYYDSPREVREGDVIRTGAGTCYRVAGVRPVGPRSKHYPYRKNLDAVRIAADDVEPDDTVHALYWYARPRRTGDNERER